MKTEAEVGEFVEDGRVVVQEALSLCSPTDDPEPMLLVAARGGDRTCFILQGAVWMQDDFTKDLVCAHVMPQVVKQTDAVALMWATSSWLVVFTEEESQRASRSVTDKAQLKKAGLPTTDDADRRVEAIQMTLVSEKFEGMALGLIDRSPDKSPTVSWLRERDRFAEPGMLGGRFPEGMRAALKLPEPQREEPK